MRSRTCCPQATGAALFLFHILKTSLECSAVAFPSHLFAFVLSRDMPQACRRQRGGRWPHALRARGRQYGSPTARVIIHRTVILCAGKTPNTNVLAIKQVRE